MGGDFMGVYFNQFDRARRCDAENCPNIDAGTRLSRLRRFCVILLLSLIFTTQSVAEIVRVATFNVSLGRRGPGVLLKHIMSGKDSQVLAVVTIIQRIQPDILLLNEFDADVTNLALTEFRKVLGAGRHSIDNEGAPSWLDLDGDGKFGEWADAFGFGRFPGSEGMALLSRYPIDTRAARQFSLLKWATLPEAVLPVDVDGSAYQLKAVSAELRMSSKSHWDVPIVFQVDRHFFKIRCDQQVVHWALVRAGCGIGFIQENIGQADPDMVQIMPEMELPALPVWLTAPEALRTNPRIRRVFDLLADGLRDMVDA